MRNLLVGDSHFMFPCVPSPVIESFICQYDICAVPGLPCDDRLLKDKLEEYRAARVVFWSCGHPLLGIRRWEEIRQKQALPVAERFLVYEESDRYMFKRAYYGRLSALLPGKTRLSPSKALCEIQHQLQPSHIHL